MADECCGLSGEVGFRRYCGSKAAWMGFVVNSADVDSFSFTLNAARTTLLRNFGQSLGMQLLLHIMNVYPIAKHLNPQTSDAYRLFSSIQTHISKDSFPEIKMAVQMIGFQWTGQGSRKDPSFCSWARMGTRSRSRFII